MKLFLYLLWLGVLTGGIFCNLSVAGTASSIASDRAIGVSGAARNKTRQGGQRWALIVGINDYTNVPRLRFARSDAEALYKVLTENCGFPKGNVVLMTDAREVRSNEFARYPTRGNLRARINQIAQVSERNDLLIVSFSGHGLNIDGRGYLVPVDGMSSDLGSLIPLSWIKETLESSPAKQRLLVLDACHSGAARSDPADSPAQALLSPLAGAAFATIASCDSRQLSHEDPETRHGVFTHAAIEGLTGKADSQAEGNRDGTVTANELFAYTSLKVKQWSLKEGKIQTPVLRGEFKDRIELAQISISGTRRKSGEVHTNSIGMKLVWIPPGEFMMGSRDFALEVVRKANYGKEEGYTNEHPQHRVRISKGFWMGVTEVTQAQWEAIMDNNGSDFKGNNLPVENVSWDDAVEFCEKLSRKEGKTYRLPTEAEWEYACRAGTTTPFHFGETINTDQANYDGNYTYGSGRKGVYRQKTIEVGSFSPNALGLYDMHGNVWEWCSDCYDANYYSKSPSVDPHRQRTSSSSFPAHRGGSWLSKPLHCRSANRSGDLPDLRLSGYGFRVVLVSDRDLTTVISKQLLK